MNAREEAIKRVIEQKALQDNLIKNKGVEDLFIFNKYVLGVEKGKLPLSEFHRELCNFVTDDKNKKKLMLLPRGHLKALHTEKTEVLTPNGFRKYKNLRVGDEVIGGDGKPTKVVKVHPKEIMELYRVTTNDGREVICNKEHLFKVRVLQNDKKWKIRNLEWILERYSKERLDKRDGKTHHEHTVQLQPILAEFEEKELPIDPYTFGMWLGDGHSDGARVTTADPEIFEYSSYEWHKLNSKYGYGTYGLQKILRTNGLKNNKHIPAIYLISSIEQRMELLRGLMDTDGTCHSQGEIGYFSNTNYKLIKDFISLVRSLGGVARICKVNQKVNDIPYDAWTVSVKLPNKLNPFNLKRKKEAFTGLKRELTINIVDIERVEEDTANCITVENPDGMFIANDYFPTHNSTLVTIGYATQQIVNNPNIRILVLSATWQMAVDFLTEIKRHIQGNERLIELYGNLTENSTEWSQDRITLQRTDTNIKGPTVWATGVDSNLVGSHPDLIILDDVVNRDNTSTREQIEKVILRYRDLLDLLEPKGQFLVIGTRWVQEDLYGWIMDKEYDISKSYKIMIKKAYEGNLATDEVQSYLWPEKFDKKILKDLLREKGIYEFSAQYLNNPIPSEDATFKREDFQYYDYEEYRGKVFNKILTVDPAISTKKEADMSALVATGIDNFGNVFVLDIVRGHFSPSQLIDQIFALQEKWHFNTIGVETIAFQKALAYTMNEEQKRRGKYLPLVEIQSHETSKDQRIRGLQPLYQSHKVYHQKDLKENIYLEDELTTFPRGRRDDIIDALSMQLQFWNPPRQKKKRYHASYLY